MLNGFEHGVENIIHNGFEGHLLQGRQKAYSLNKGQLHIKHVHIKTP